MAFEIDICSHYCKLKMQANNENEFGDKNFHGFTLVCEKIGIPQIELTQQSVVAVRNAFNFFVIAVSPLFQQ